MVVVFDGCYVYVSNYLMYGLGVGFEGFDVCGFGDAVGELMVYRVDVSTLVID